MAITLIHGDCNKYLAGCKDKQFSLGIVDPPYGIGAGSVSFKSGTRKKSTFHKAEDWDSTVPTKEYFNELLRVSQNEIIWGGQLHDRLFITRARMDILG